MNVFPEAVCTASLLFLLLLLQLANLSWRNNCSRGQHAEGLYWHSSRGDLTGVCIKTRLCSLNI